MSQIIGSFVTLDTGAFNRLPDCFTVPDINNGESGRNDRLFISDSGVQPKRIPSTAATQRKVLDDISDRRMDGWLGEQRKGIWATIGVLAGLV